MCLRGHYGSLHWLLEESRCELMFGSAADNTEKNQSVREVLWLIHTVVDDCY